MDVSKYPYNSLIYKFLRGEFTEGDFQEIYGESLGTHFYKRYDSGAGIESLFRQFSGGNETKLLNLFLRERNTPGIATYQLLRSYNDPSGNPRRLVLLYDAAGNVRKAIRYGYSSPKQAISNERLNPDHYTRLPDMELSKAIFDRWESDLESDGKLKQHT